MGKVYCGICGKRCKGDVLKVHDKFIHKACFLCCCCKLGLDKGGFFLKDDKYYCKNDYLERFGVKCNVCREIAEGEVIIIFGTTFHLTCFKCTICQFLFQRGDKVTLSDNEYLCPHCFLKRNTTNGTIKREKSLEKITVKEPESAPDRNVMTTSMISTVLSDSSEYEPTSPEKVSSVIDTLSPGVTGDQKIRFSQWGDLPFEDNRSSDSECLSIRTEPDTSHFNGLYKKKGIRNYLLGGSSACLKTPFYGKSSFGRFYNVSYLQIEQQMKTLVHPKAIYKQSRTSNNNSLTNIHHFHKLDNFSYRSQPNITMKRDTYNRPNLSTVMNHPKTATNGLEKGSLDMMGFKIPIASMIDLHNKDSVTFGSTNNNKIIPVKNPDILDPILASRVPSANYESQSKLRFDRHTFTSPSRNIINLQSNREVLRPENSNFSTDNAIKICQSLGSTECHLPSNKAPQIICSRDTNLITRSQIIQRDSSESDYISVQSFLKTSRSQLSESHTPKNYSYEQLKISNFSLPRGVDRSRLEIHLSDDEFHKLFKLCRDAFYRLPEWKQNDLKKRVDLF